MHRNISAILALLAFAAASQGQVVHTPSYPFNGDSASDLFGVSVSGAGDVDGDGFDDFIVGAHFDDTNGTLAGMARVFSGANGSILYTFNGDSANDRFGYSVSGAGDVDNDGFADLIVGAYSDTSNGVGSGSARVFSGVDGSILYTFNGDSSNVEFGWSVSGAGDVNNDGFDDLIVGAWLDDTNGNNSGSARVFSGADGSILYTFYGDSAGDEFGYSVSGAGDVNNDGFDDVVVGAWASDSNGVFSGIARVFSGMDGSVLHTFAGSAESGFGGSVNSAGDINSDGFADIIIGAPFDNSDGNFTGSAVVFSGVDGAILHSLHGEWPFGEFGFSVDALGDINGDGVPDLIVGAQGGDENGLLSGSARVYSGADGAILYTFNGTSAGDRFGCSVSAAGDVNNDGYPDFVVGAYGDDNNGEDSGSAFVFRSVALPAACPGDTNGDHVVNFTDLNAVLSNYGAPCPEESSKNER